MWSAPESEEYRAESVDAYAELAPGESTELFLDTFDRELARATPDPAEPLREADQILAYPDEDTALIDPAGPQDRALHISSAPLLTDEGELPDLDLHRRGDQITPDEPLNDVAIPDELADGIALDEANVSVGVLGAKPGDPDSRLVSTSQGEGDKEASFYPEALIDTDIAVAPTTSGFETFAQLRSESSPEEIVYSINLPAGGSIEGDEVGGALLKNGGGKPLVAVEPPLASDAQGRDVPLTMTVQGNNLVLEVPHQDADFAYPILVDPVFEYWPWISGLNLDGFNYWTYNSNGWSNYAPSMYCSGYIPQSCEGTGWGMGIYAAPGRWFPGNSWVDTRYTAPGTTSYITTAWFYYDRYFRGGGSQPAQPYGYAGLLHSSGTFWEDIGYYYFNWAGNWTLYGSYQEARQLVVGMGAGYDVTPSAWRYLRIMELGLDLTDPEAPSITKPVPSSGVTPPASGWYGAGNSGILKVDATATDPGLGVKNLSLTIPQQAGGSLSVSADPYPTCFGSKQYGVCPSSRTDAFVFNTPEAPMPEGKNTVTFTATDALDRVTQRNYKVKIDRSAPNLSQPTGDLSGPGAMDAPDHPSVVVDGSDGSGLESLKLVADAATSNPVILTELDPESLSDGQSCTGGTCTFHYELTPDISGLSYGSHTIKVLATDLAGHQTGLTREFARDQGNPTLDPIASSSLPTNWFSSDRVVTFDVSARDVGAGVKRIDVITPDPDDPAATVTTSPYSSGCTGTSASPCQTEIAQQVTLDTSTLPTGWESEVTVKAYDALSKVSSGQTFYLKRDRHQPQLRIAGAPPEAEAEGDPAFAVDVDASDGVPGSKESGVEMISVAVDDEVIESTDQECPQGNCTLSLAATLDTVELSDTEHTLGVTARDAAGNSVTQSQTFQTGDDTRPPKLAATGPALDWSDALGPVETDVHVAAADSGSGVSALAVHVDGEEVETISQGCPDGACDLLHDFTVSLEDETPGQHVLAVAATDAAGNEETISRQIVVDPDAPVLDVSGDFRDPPTGWVDQGNHQVAVTGNASLSGPVQLQLAIDGAQVQQAPAQCSSVGCEFDHTFTVNTAEFSGGAHEVQLSATSGGSHVAIDRWTVRLVPNGTISSAEAASTIAATSPSRTSPSGEEVVDGQTVSPTLAPSANDFVISQSLVDGTVDGNAASGFAIETNEGPISMAPVAAAGASNARIENADSAVYSNVANETDLLVRPRPFGITAAEQLRSASSPHSQEWQLDLGPGQTLEMSLNDGIQITGANGEPIALMSPPHAVDAGGDEISAEVVITGAQTIRVTVAPTTEYPTFVDVSLTPAELDALALEALDYVLEWAPYSGNYYFQPSLGPFQCAASVDLPYRFGSDRAAGRGENVCQNHPNYPHLWLRYMSMRTCLKAEGPGGGPDVWFNLKCGFDDRYGTKFESLTEIVQVPLVSFVVADCPYDNKVLRMRTQGSGQMERVDRTHWTSPHLQTRPKWIDCR